jgi:WD40 repeat protein
VWTVAWSPDGKTLATASSIYEPIDDKDDKAGKAGTSTVKLWDPQKGEEKRSFGAEKKTNIQEMVFSPDGKTLAIQVRKPIEVNAGQVRFVDPHQGALQRTIEFAGALGGVAYSPDGTTLAFGGTIDEGGFRTLVVKLWDVEKGQERREMKRKVEAELVGGVLTLRACIQSLRFSPDGRTLATVEGDHKIRLWDTQTGRLEQTFEGHNDHIWSIAFAPDGKTLVSTGQDQTIYLWDTRTGERKRTLAGHKGMVFSVAFSPDGKSLATGGAIREGDKVTGEILLWDVHSGEMRRSLPGHESFVHAVVAFSPDGKTLAVGVAGPEKDGKATGEVRLWAID